MKTLLLLPRRFLAGAIALMLGLFLSTAPLLPPAAHAHELEKEMKKMGRAFRNAREAEDPLEMLEPLEVMRAQAQKIREEMAPHDADEDDHEEFKQGMDKLLVQIDAALEAADEEDEDALTAAMRELRALRKKYHERFEVDDD